MKKVVLGNGEYVIKVSRPDEFQAPVKLVFSKLPSGKFSHGDAVKSDEGKPALEISFLSVGAVETFISTVSLLSKSISINNCIACFYSGKDEQAYRAHGCPKCTCTKR
jgi:hypothetical protein